MEPRAQRATRRPAWQVAAAAVVLALIGGAAGGVSARCSSARAGRAVVAGAAAAVDVAASGELQLLRSELLRESEARETLAGEVALLRAVIGQLGRASAGRVPPRAAAAQEAEEELGAGATPEPDEGTAPAPGGLFDVGALAGSGLQASEVERLRYRWEESELDKLYLTDRATREGWVFTNRYRKEHGQLSNSLRNELGDDSYEQVLYATGQKNRVLVRGVLGRSSASEVGLTAGDQILSYGGRRIFRPGELRGATTSGRQGELVPIVILRGRERRTVWVRRGPIGALLDFARRPPLS